MRGGSNEPFRTQRGRQLGEHIPALDIAAKSMDMTSSEFIKMVERGEVMAGDFLPKFAAEIMNTVKANGSLEASLKKLEARQTRATNAFKLMWDEIFQETGTRAIGTFFDNMADFFTNNKDALVSWGNAIFDTIHAINTLANALVDVVSAGNPVSEVLTRSFSGLASVLYTVLGVLTKITYAFTWLDAFSSGSINFKGEDTTPTSKEDMWSSIISRGEFTRPSSGMTQQVNIEKVEVMDGADFLNEVGVLSSYYGN